MAQADRQRDTPGPWPALVPAVGPAGRAGAQGVQGGFQRPLPEAEGILPQGQLHLFGGGRQVAALHPQGAQGQMPVIMRLQQR